MALPIRILMAVAVLALSAGTALARQATTATALAMREGPGANYTRLLTMPPGARVHMGDCVNGWCTVRWNGTSGFASQSGLLTHYVYAREPELWPIYPAYPYRSGYYPKADWYYDMPPYLAISPSFYRRRFFMMAQERDRYRYMPHIFRGYSTHYGESGGIGSVDIQGIAASLNLSVNTPPP
jgi:Bacterial SH3 domain